MLLKSLKSRLKKSKNEQNSLKDTNNQIDDNKKIKAKSPMNIDDDIKQPGAVDSNVENFLGERSENEQSSDEYIEDEDVGLDYFDTFIDVPKSTLNVNWMEIWNNKNINNDIRFKLLSDDSYITYMRELIKKCPDSVEWNEVTKMLAFIKNQVVDSNSHKLMENKLDGYVPKQYYFGNNKKAPLVCIGIKRKMKKLELFFEIFDLYIDYNNPVVKGFNKSVPNVTVTLFFEILVNPSPPCNACNARNKICE